MLEHDVRDEAGLVELKNTFLQRSTLSEALALQGIKIVDTSALPSFISRFRRAQDYESAALQIQYAQAFHDFLPMTLSSGAVFPAEVLKEYGDHARIFRGWARAFIKDRVHRKFRATEITRLTQELTYGESLDISYALYDLARERDAIITTLSDHHTRPCLQSEASQTLDAIMNKIRRTRTPRTSGHESSYWRRVSAPHDALIFTYACRLAFQTEEPVYIVTRDHHFEGFKTQVDRYLNRHPCQDFPWKNLSIINLANHVPL